MKRMAKTIVTTIVTKIVTSEGARGAGAALYAEWRPVSTI